MLFRQIQQIGYLQDIISMERGLRFLLVMEQEHLPFLIIKTHNNMVKRFKNQRFYGIIKAQNQPRL